MEWFAIKIRPRFEAVVLNKLQRLKIETAASHRPDVVQCLLFPHQLPTIHLIVGVVAILDRVEQKEEKTA